MKKMRDIRGWVGAGTRLREGFGRLEINNERRDFFMYNSPDNVYSDDLTTPKRTK